MSTDVTKRLPYFLPNEVALHNTIDDCWLSCLGRVYDLTEYVALKPESMVCKYLLAHGGKDVSHWFDARSKRLRRYVDPATGCRRILLPFEFPLPEGVYSTLAEECNDNDDCSQHGDEKKSAYNTINCSRCATRGLELTGKCWSELEYVFGSDSGNGVVVVHQCGWLTKKPRPCGITNVLTGQRAIISVCTEDKISRIQERALSFNRHCTSYTWKYEGKILNPGLTLAENGIPDESDRYIDCGLPDDRTTYVPNLICYFNDDLTVL